MFRLLKVKLPDASAVVVALAAPLNVTVAALPPALLIVPEMENVVGATEAKATPATFAELTVTAWFGGVKV